MRMMWGDAIASLSARNGSHRIVGLRERAAAFPLVRMLHRMPTQWEALGTRLLAAKQAHSAKKGGIMPSKLSITKERTAELVKEFGRDEKDCGNANVQVAILSERIRNLTEHLKSHPKDHHTRRGLMKLIGKRRSMLKYIKARDIEEYRALIKKLGIRDNI